MQASAVAGARAFAGCARCDTDPAPSPLVPSRPVARPPPFAHGAHHADTCPDSPLSTAYVYRRTPLGLPDALEALLLGICCFCGGALVLRQILGRLPVSCVVASETDILDGIVYSLAAESTPDNGEISRNFSM